MRIYLDLCCLNRPLDDQSQPRVWLESDAIRLILQQCAQGTHQWVSSEALEFEAGRNPDKERRGRVLAMLQHADERFVLDDATIDLARSFERQGLRGMDALHLATAERATCHLLLTADDRFVKRARDLRPRPKVVVENPARWAVENINHDS